MTARGRSIRAETPGRFGLASSCARIRAEACSTSGLAIRTTSPRRSEASTTASRSMTPIWGAARPMPGIASIVWTMSSQTARTASVIAPTGSAALCRRRSS